MTLNLFFIFLLFFFFFLSTLTLNVTSTTLERDHTNFNRWISWHVKNHNKKNVDLKETNSISQKAASTKSTLIDWKLQMAETSKTEIKVSQDGNGDFKTIKEAIESIPLRNTRRVMLYLNSGVYREKVNIPRTMHFITFIGNASDPPTITGNDTASSMNGPPRTFQSATVAVDADYFVAINVKFENTAPHVVGSVGGQAVALRISGTKAAFYNCSFYGSQDTLYDHKGLHFFSNCFIQGSVDFIFGYGTSLYQNCYLNSVSKKVASVTAQKRTNSSMSSGFSFKNCTISGSGSIYLGRAWGDYSRVVFSYTFMDKIVIPQGWSDWGNTNLHQKVYYGEYKCSGPGSNLTGRVPWARVLTNEEAQPFIDINYINGDTWLMN